MQSDRDKREPIPVGDAQRMHGVAPEHVLPNMLRLLGQGQDRVPREDTIAKDRLLEDLHNTDWSIRVAVLHKLSRGEREIPSSELLAALEDTRAEVRSAAVRALGKPGENALVERMLDDTAWPVRAAAIQVLGKNASQIPVERLVKLVQLDEEQAVRAAAVQALAKLATHAPLETLVQATGDPSWLVREAAVTALGEQGQRAPREPLQNALEDRDMSVRMAAREALQLIASTLSTDRAKLESQKEDEEDSEAQEIDREDGLGEPEGDNGRRAEKAEQNTANPDNKQTQQEEKQGEAGGQRLHTIFNELPLPSTGNQRSEGRESSRWSNDNFSWLAGQGDQIIYSPLPEDSIRQQPTRQVGASKRRSWQTGAAILVAASLILAALLVFKGPGRTSTGSLLQCPPAIAVGAGCAFFENSRQGPLLPNSDLGTNDTFTIDLAGIANPGTGKAYYAWLLGDPNNPEAPALLLGKVPVQQGTVHFIYHDPQQVNLLGTVAAFLITEEDASLTPLNPTPDHSAWHYYTKFSTRPDPADTVNHYSLLDHLRHLLAVDPSLATVGLYGGLGSWLLRNTQQLTQWAQAARDAKSHQDGQALHNQLVNMLYYLDSDKYVQTDIPAGTPALTDPASKQASQVALLEISQQQSPAGYLKHIGYHLNAIATSPYATAYQRALAIQINNNINALNSELQQVRSAARQLVNMSTTQILQPGAQSTLEQLFIHIANAYNGWTVNGQAQKGAVQIYKDLQYLAVFEILAK